MEGRAEMVQAGNETGMPLMGGGPRDKRGQRIFRLVDGRVPPWKGRVISPF